MQELFQSKFPGRVLVNDRRYYESPDYHAIPLWDVHHKRERDSYFRGVEYLSSMDLLSRCDIMVGGLCGGSQAALLMNQGKYKEVHLFDCGNYGV